MAGATIGYGSDGAYRISAGLLTLFVHALFLALLYLGVSWKAQQPKGMMVELWSDLPQDNTLAQEAQPPAAPPAPAKAEQAKPKPQEMPVTKAEINLQDKKRKPKEGPKPQKPAVSRKSNADMQELFGQAEKAEQQSRASQVAGLAAIKIEMDKYKGLISSKIRHNIVMPPDVAENVRAEFVVTLLPGGSVLDATLLKPSGNAAYDEAVERAIRKSVPLPLPENETARMQFLNPNRLTLKFSPKD